MPVVHLLDAAGLLPGDTAQELLALARATAEEVAEDLDLGPVDVAVCDYPGLPIQELAIGGYAPGPRTAFLAIDPSNPAFTQWRDNLPTLLAHELHHVRRWQGPGYGPTLLDSLVSEGSATCYEAQHFGRMPIYTDPPGDLDELWRLAQPLLSSTDQHPRWFFGTADLARWAGYALGYELTRRHCAATGATAAEVATVPAGELAQAW